MEIERSVLDGSPPIPEDIIFFEIFPRLPVKSLHRFRCASKFCRSLTSHPRFLDAFRSRSRRHYLLSFSSSGHWQCVFYSLNPESCGQSHAKIIDYFKNPRYYTYAKFINGFMCLVRGDKVFVCNGGTNEKFLLPQLWSHSKLERHFVYFCYDPETDKYKVLRTTSVRIDVNGNLIVVAMRYSIFTLGVDKWWRDFDHPELCQLGNSKSVCVNGILFSTNFSTSSNVEDGVIAAYVVGSEDFDIVTYPEGLSPLRYSSCHLIELKGIIAIADVEDFKSCMIRLWIKVKGFGFESWIEHRIEFPSQWETIFNLSCNFSFNTNREGEIIMGSSGMSTPGCWIFCYNMETGKWRRIEIVGPDQRVILGDFFVEEYLQTFNDYNSFERRSKMLYTNILK
ncbi:hypothetical protein Pfo_009612 [Paulownia fortunei]|nr:hypothetical protein Pfo_009612 [Paulownia fortunei]